jgi:hypothetical protein
MNRTACRIAGLATLLAVTATTAHADDPAITHDLATPRVPRRHHVRMAIELATIFAAGNRWYWRDNGEPNRVDWQLPWGKGAIEAKLLDTRGWRFDGNPYDINALGHPAFGMLTTFLARENGYGLGESFAISTLASGTWEVFLEWAEYGSLNDIAMTSTAGIPLGETAYQMIHHLRETHVELRGGFGNENGAAFAVVGARGELDLIPTTGEGTFRAGRHTAFAIELPSDDQGVRSYSGGAKTTLAGYYRNTEDTQLVAGVSAEYDYRKQEDRPEREWDLLTTFAVGPSIDYRIRQGGVTVDVGTDLYVDFGMLKAEGFDAWRAEHPTMVMRNVMANREHPYYFAGGGSIDPRVDVAYRGYSAGTRVSASLFSSFDGADRDQEMITTKVHFRDSDASAATYIGYERGGVSLTLDGRLHRRGGRAGDVEASSSERVAMLTVGVRR